ncbi:serine/threonine protein kinase [Zhongshania sp.]|uniref:serine/threonine protein kinase n=1 Tax=Zhongshania sp. TaxID=1971902 RepID=UPI00356AAC7C
MKKLFALTTMATAIGLVGCGGGGDININAQNNSTTTNPGGGSSTTNKCASYSSAAGSTRQGSIDGVNCIYGPDFVSLNNPIDIGPTAPVVFTKLANGGVHVFRDSLVIGRNYSSDAELAAAGIVKGGDGSIIQIEAGTTLAFQSSDDYMVINRGSQIFAEGTASEPITITSVSDAVQGTVGPEDVQAWGGMIINGFGLTNKCAYTGSPATNDLATAGSGCHVAAEGKAGAGQTHYGGANNADNSGVLKYFIVKHTGAQVEEGNELNGISFDAVGSATKVDYLQAYSTYDDGVEMFGGAVNISHYIAMYVRDDSIDIDEGYSGTFDYALVIQSEKDGNHCVESDGIGSYSSKDQATIDDFVARGLNSRATIKNMTCIMSSNDGPASTAAGLGTHDPGAGMRIREAHFPVIQNALITSAYQGDVLTGDDDYNYCVRIESAEGLKAAADGILKIEGSIIACSDLTKGDPLPGGKTQLAFLNESSQAFHTLESGEDPTAASNANLDILDSFYSLPVSSMKVGGAAPIVVPVGGRAFFGAVVKDDDWTAGWAYGIDPANRGQDLWFD